MELFSEIYSCYYAVTNKILNSVPLTKTEIDKIIRENAFSESALFLLPKLCRKNGWGLLKEINGEYFSILKNCSELPITLLEKRWLKALLFNERVKLFLTETEFKILTEKLQNVEPLFNSQHFKLFDIFKDGDDYSNAEYIKHFRTVLLAIKEKRVLNIAFNSGKGKRIRGNFLPYRIEYSKKNDKFRVYVSIVKSGKISTNSTINISRITAVFPTEQIIPINIEINEVFNIKRCNKPITLEILNERNGVERFMMEFASFEKQTEIDEQSRKCIAKLWYDKQDETEVLIRLLAFGVVIKVLDPPEFQLQIKERIDRQFEYIK